MKVIWSPLALDRVVEQADLIAADKPGASSKWLAEVFALAEGLQHFPELGRVVPELGRRDFREIAHGKYRVIYRLEAEQVTVLTVRHSRRLLDRGELDG